MRDFLHLMTPNFYRLSALGASCSVLETTVPWHVTVLILVITMITAGPVVQKFQMNSMCSINIQHK